MVVDQETFTVEQGYKIGLIFFLDLWDLLEPDVKELEGDNTLIVHELFFREVCLGFEASAEWIEAVFRTKHVPREDQKQLKLTEPELFACSLEFCKLHNERWEHILDYTVKYLESMQDYPEMHSSAWAVWEKAKNDVVSQRTTFYDIDWTAELP